MGAALTKADRMRARLKGDHVVCTNQQKVHVHVRGCLQHSSISHDTDKPRQKCGWVVMC